MSLCQGKGDKDPSFTFPGPDQTQGMVVLWKQLKVVASSPIAHPSSALHSHTKHRKLQKGRAGSKNPALLDLARKVALPCHRSSTQSELNPVPTTATQPQVGESQTGSMDSYSPNSPRTTWHKCDTGLFLPANCLLLLLLRERHQCSTSRSAPCAASVPKLHSPRAQQEPVSGSLRVKLGLVPGGHKPR